MKFWHFSCQVWEVPEPSRHCMARALNSPLGKALRTTPPLATREGVLLSRFLWQQYSFIGRAWLWQPWKGVSLCREVLRHRLLTYTCASAIFPSPDLDADPFNPSGHSGQERGKGAWQMRKSQSLPKRLPGNDPILVALRKFKTGNERQASPLSNASVPTSPDSVLSPTALSPYSDDLDSQLATDFHHAPFSGEFKPNPISVALRAGTGAEVSPEERQRRDRRGGSGARWRVGR